MDRFLTRLSRSVGFVTMTWFQIFFWTIGPNAIAGNQPRRDRSPVEARKALETQFDLANDSGIRALDRNGRALSLEEVLNQREGELRLVSPLGFQLWIRSKGSDLSRLRLAIKATDSSGEQVLSRRAVTFDSTQDPAQVRLNLVRTLSSMTQEIQRGLGANNGGNWLHKAARTFKGLFGITEARASSSELDHQLATLVRLGVVLAIGSVLMSWACIPSMNSRDSVVAVIGTVCAVCVGFTVFNHLMDIMSAERR